MQLGNGLESKQQRRGMMTKTRFHLPMVLTLLLAGVWAAGWLALPTAATAQSDQPILLAQYGDWGVYTATPGGKKICFALSKPTASRTDPPGRSRGQPYFFVSTRTDEGVREEVSTLMGYPLRPGTDGILAIATDTFPMYTQGDGAWIKNVADQTRLVAAMRAGTEMQMKGTSTRGTDTYDTYSLRGVTQSLDRIRQECR